MSDIQIFNNPEFGEIRTIEQNGEPWFVGKDIATALGYSNPQKAIRDHVDEQDRTANESFTVNGTQGVLVNESGLYSLCFSSKLEGAKKFKRWVTSKVLPSIRKTGGYIMPGNGSSLQALDLLVKSLHEQQDAMNRMYVVQEEQTAELGKVKEQVNLMCEISSTSVGDDWRTACTNAIRAVAFKRGGRTHYSEVWNAVYDKMKLNGFDVRKRLDNRKKGAIATGMRKSYVEKINALDVIADSKDKKLISAFISAVKEIAAAEGVKIAQKEDKPATEQQYFNGMNEVEG